MSDILDEVEQLVNAPGEADIDLVQTVIGELTEHFFAPAGAPDFESLTPEARAAFALVGAQIAQDAVDTARKFMRAKECGCNTCRLTVMFYAAVLPEQIKLTAQIRRRLEQEP
jgi:hypothetical protein